jgi:hypothetical protein
MQKISSSPAILSSKKSMGKVAMLNKGKHLTEQEAKFVEIKARTGNGTLAVKEAFGIKNDGYARVKAHYLLTKPNIVKSIQDALPDSLLSKVHKEGLKASFKGEPDYGVRHKYLDSAYKLKGSYAAEKHVNVNLQVSAEEREKILGLSNKVLEEMSHDEING